MIRTGKHVRKFHYKNLLKSAYLRGRAQLSLDINQMYFSLPDNFFLIFTKRKQRDSSKFLNKFGNNLSGRPEPGPSEKANPGLLEKADPIPKFTILND